MVDQRGAGGVWRDCFFVPKWRFPFPDLGNFSLRDRFLRLVFILKSCSRGFDFGILSLLAGGEFTRILVAYGRFWYIFEKKSALLMIKNTRNGDRRAGFW